MGDRDGEVNHKRESKADQDRAKEEQQQDEDAQDVAEREFITFEKAEVIEKVTTIESLKEPYSINGEV